MPVLLPGVRLAPPGRSGVPAVARALLAPVSVHSEGEDEGGEDGGPGGEQQQPQQAEGGARPSQPRPGRYSPGRHTGELYTPAEDATTNTVAIT